MSVIKNRLAEKIRLIDGFEHVKADDLLSQPSKKIRDIPRWFYGNVSCFHTMTECAKAKHTLRYDEYLQEFLIPEIDQP